MRKRSLLQILLIPALAVGILGTCVLFQRQDSSRAAFFRRRLSEYAAPPRQLLGESKPVIYTFYHEFNGGGGDTGMTAQADEVLLKIWKGEWQNAGWIPRILTMEDARQHPHFGTLNTMLNGLPFKMYDRLCFIRWLAMSNQPGGGFMADYDTFPLAWLADGLPNGGRLTVHEHSNSGGVPSLLSASQGEWFRFAWALAENALVHKHEHHWSDMKAMQDIYKQSNEEAYVMSHGVLPGLAVLHGNGYPQETCDRASRAFAVHFSHHAVDKGTLPQGIAPGPQSRAQVAEEWLGAWRKNCEVRSATPLAGGEAPLPEGMEEESSLSMVAMKEPMAARGDKPVIFTFYEEVDEKKHTGMTEEDNQNLIQAWARSWYEVGWEPRLLDVSLARQHPEFKTFDGFLDGLPFRKFDRICFYRWLAMGMAGGGWLSDYDTFPLNRVKWDGSGDPSFLPNTGTLTVHEMSKRGGVPSLVSGNANEWFRLAKAQVENARQHETQPHWSDMKAMQDLYQQSDGKFYQMMENVVMGDAMLRNKQIDRATCTWLQTKLAIHFSHFSMHRTGRYETPLEGARHRAEVGRNWILEYKQSCAAYETTT